MKTLTHRSLILLLISLFAVVSSHAASEQASPSARENPGSLPILISLEHVSKDLHLTSLQKSVIAGLRSDYRAAALKITKAHYQTSSEVAQAQVKLDELALSYNHRAMAVLNGVQRSRLRQVERQILGGTLLIAPSEQQFLGLTSLQKQKIETIHQDAYKKAMKINLRADQGKLGYHQQVAALRKNRKVHAAAMLKVLTPEQLKVWNQSQGNKLVF